MEMVSPFAVELLLPSFLSGLAVKASWSPNFCKMLELRPPACPAHLLQAKPTQKEATLQIISALAAKAPRAVGHSPDTQGEASMSQYLYDCMRSTSQPIDVACFFLH